MEKQLLLKIANGGSWYRNSAEMHNNIIEWAYIDTKPFSHKEELYSITVSSSWIGKTCSKSQTNSSRYYTQWSENLKKSNHLWSFKLLK